MQMMMILHHHHLHWMITNKMVADAMTKNLTAPAFEQHRATMLGATMATPWLTDA
jgi:hypothetical protein